MYLCLVLILPPLLGFMSFDLTILLSVYSIKSLERKDQMLLIYLSIHILITMTMALILLLPFHPPPLLVLYRSLIVLNHLFLWYHLIVKVPTVTEKEITLLGIIANSHPRWRRILEEQLNSKLKILHLVVLSSLPKIGSLNRFLNHLPTHTPTPMTMTMTTIPIRRKRKKEKVC